MQLTESWTSWQHSHPPGAPPKRFAGSSGTGVLLRSPCLLVRLPQSGGRPRCRSHTSPASDVASRPEAGAHAKLASWRRRHYAATVGNDDV